jgi:hypothetical protein
MIMCICVFTYVFMKSCMYVSVESETDTPGGTAGRVGDGNAGEGVGEEFIGNFPDKWPKATISIRMRNSDIKNDSSQYGINFSRI